MTTPQGLTRRQFTGLGLAGALAFLVSCGSDGDGRRRTVTRGGSRAATGAVARSDLQRLVADPGLVTDVIAATNAFAADLYRLAIEDFDNLAFSPLSIAIALAMTSEGARGTSREQIEKVFRLERIEDPHGGWNTVEQALTTRSGHVARDDGSTDDLVLTLVNQLWGQARFEIEDAFLAVMAASYGAGVNLVDFEADPEAARVEINEWVATQTRDRIPELIPVDIIDTYTRLVLTNAVYFRAPWAHPFEKAATRDGGFTRLDGSTVQVPLMSADGRFATHEGDGWHAVELAYAGEKLEMLLVVPDAGRFAEVEERLGEGLLDEIPPGLERARLMLTTPRFTIRTPLLLKERLAALGMPDPFDWEVADFSGINAELGKKLYIKDVVHEAFVAVDETGTEAAAATAVIINIESAAPALVIDRPFLWAIRDVPTKALLFLGRVVDPSLGA